MKILPIVLALLVNIVSTAHAVTRYVDDGTPTGCSTPTDTDYSPTANSGAGGCGSGSSTIYIGSGGIQLGLAALVAGDRLEIRGGNYTNNSTYLTGFGGYAPGQGSWETATVITNYAAETVTVTGAGSFYHSDLYQANLGYIIWKADTRGHFIVQGAVPPAIADVQGLFAFQFIGTGAHHIRLQSLIIRNSRNGIGVGSHANHIEVIDNEISGHGSDRTQDHGIYASSADDLLVERNYFYNNQGYALHGWNNGSVNGNMRWVVRYNVVDGRKSTTNGTAFAFMTQGGNGGIFYGNAIRGIGAGAVRYNGCFQFYAPGTSQIVLNNTCYDTLGTGVEINSGVTGTVVKNNIFNAVAEAINDAGASTSGVTNICSTNDTAPTGTCSTVTASPGFVSSGTGDFSLASGSTAVDEGTAQSGYAFNGASPDAGAYESSGGFSTASIDLNVMDVTLGMNLNTPLLPASGITGFTVACSGSNCGTPVVASAARKVGTDSVVRLTISGIGDDGNCDAAQTWTVSYSPGTLTDSTLVGGSLNQKMFAFTTQPVTATCSGSGTPAPGTPYIQYEIEDATGTNINDSSANNLDGTVTGGGSIAGAGHTGLGYTTTNGAAHYIAVPYGSGVNPSTQSLTIAFGVLVDSSLVSQEEIYFGSTVGTNQRLYIGTFESTWQLGIQASSIGTTSNLAVTSGWHRVCLNLNSGTDTATLSIDGVAGTGEASKVYTSYSLASNFRIGSPFDATPGTTYDEFKVWQSVESCATDFAAWEQVSPAPTGTFEQKTHKWQRLRKKVDLSADDFTATGVANGITIPVVIGGAVALITQIDCTGADCDPTGPRLYYSKNGGAITQVPDVCASDGVCFYGTPDTDIVSGDITCPITGALDCNAGDGPTNTSASAVPIFDLDEDASFVRRSILRFTATVAPGDTFCFQEYHQTGLPLDLVTPSDGACVRIIDYAS